MAQGQQPVVPVRVPLVSGIERRSATEDKDELAVNIFYDKNTNVDKTMYGLHEVLNTFYATKRPGLTSFITGSGQAKGIFGYGGDLFTFSPAFYDWTTGQYLSGKYIILGGNEYLSNGKLYSQVSTDGLNWATYEVSTSYDPISTPGVWYSSKMGSQMVVAGAVDNVSGLVYAFSTTDGISWVESSIFTSPMAGIPYFICNTGTTYIVWGITNIYSTSTNGTTWTEHVASAIPSFGYYVGAIGANSSISVALPSSVFGVTTTFYTSSDTINWTSRTLPITRNWKSIVWAASLGLFVAVSQQVASEIPYIITSPDGITWTLQLASTGQGWKAIFWTGTYLIAFGSGNNAYYYSIDAIHWIEASVPFVTNVSNNAMNAYSNGTQIVFIEGNGGLGDIEREATSLTSTFIKKDLPSLSRSTPTVTTP